jgi:hypothetical protein
MRVLDGMPEVEKTSVFGTAVHAVLKPGSASGADADLLSADLGRRLGAAGVAVDSTSVVPPSLEDVFLEVAGRIS